jgi:cytochrome c biogenesis protein CcmG, thiol:disulfide interchange protein DsbE
MKRFILWVPLTVFLVFLVTVGVGLYAPSDRTIHSQMVGKPLPEVSLPPMLPDRPGIDIADYGNGEPRIINIFASWCVPCIAEAPQLEAIAERGIPIDAVAVRDRPQDVAQFLERWGDPYARIGSDENSRVQMALGASGVPETFIVDGEGVIRYYHWGPINAPDVPDIVAAYEALK